MVGRRYRQRVIVMSRHGKNVGRIARHLRFDGVVEAMCPVETLVDLPAIDEAQVVHDVAARDDENVAIPQRREARREAKREARAGESGAAPATEPDAAPAEPTDAAPADGDRTIEN